MSYEKIGDWVKIKRIFQDTKKKNIPSKIQKIFLPNTPIKFTFTKFKFKFKIKIISRLSLFL